jgi:anti-sigma28 factor (negative regulator of flagellin synthesis)
VEKFEKERLLLNSFRINADRGVVQRRCVVMVVDRLGSATTDFSKSVQSKSPAGTAPVKSADSAQPKQTAVDTTSFTAATNTVQALSKTALQTSPTRQSKVESLRQAVKSAQYQLDSVKISESIANSDI